MRGWLRWQWTRFRIWWFDRKRQYADLERRMASVAELDRLRSPFKRNGTKP